MLKPDIFLKNRLLNKDYHHNECLKELQHKKKIPNAINSSRAVYELKKPTEKFDLFMRKTFTRELKTPKSAIKPISLNSVTQNSNFLDIRRGSLFNPNNKEKDIISSQNSKKQLRFSQNNISSSEDEIQLSKMKRDLTFSSHLQELRNLKEDQKLDRKINKINELQREKNRKLSKRMSILKFITALKSSKNLLNGNFHINPIVSPNNLSNMDNKRYFSLMADLNNMIEKLSKNIQILLDRAGGNRMLIAKSLKKQKGYNEVIGNLLLDPKKIELSPNLTKEELTKKIEKHIVGSRAVCLGFLDKVNYFNNNLLSYVIEKDKEWFEQKTNEIKNGLENWKKIKENYLEKVASKSQVLFFSKKKVIEEASNYFQPQNSLMNKIIWENLEKNERNLGQLTQVGKFNRAQWMNIQNLESVFD